MTSEGEPTDPTPSEAEAAESRSHTGFGELLGVAVDPDATPEAAQVRLTADARHLNPAGKVHGGVLATLVDTAMGMAVHAASDGEGAATSQLTVSYLNPADPGELLATARVRKHGHALTVAEAEIEQDGKAIVHAIATFARMSS